MRQFLETFRRWMPSWFPQVVGYALSALCLLWVLHNYNLGELAAAIRTLDWKWVALSVAADLSVYLVHAWRWNTLLGPVVRLRDWRTVQAIYIGLFANEVLPLRVGELIRCYLLAHWNDFRISLSFASAAVERIIDGFWMLAAFLVTAGFVRRIPRDFILLVQAIGALLLVAVVLLVWIIYHKQHVHLLIRENRWAATLRHIVEGVHLMGNRRTIGFTVLISGLYLALQVVSVWALMNAYGFDLSFWIAGGVLVLVRLGTVIPNAPGNLGLIQVACVVALRLFDVESDAAKTFSFVMFFALTIPLLVGGAIATALTGVNIGELRDRAQRGAIAVPHDA